MIKARLIPRSAMTAGGKFPLASAIHARVYAQTNTNLCTGRQCKLQMCSGEQPPKRCMIICRHSCDVSVFSVAMLGRQDYTSCCRHASEDAPQLSRPTAIRGFLALPCASLRLLSSSVCHQWRTHFLSLALRFL